MPFDKTIHHSRVVAMTTMVVVEVGIVGVVGVVVYSSVVFRLTISKAVMQ